MSGTLMKVVNLDNVTLSNGSNVTRRLNSENLWTALQFRFQGTTANGPPGSVQLDGELNAFQRVILRANGRTIFNLVVADQFFRATYQNRTQGNRTAVTTTVGATNFDLLVPLALPYPAKYPGNAVTGMPAGILNNITIEIQSASDIVTSVFGTPGSTSWSVGPTVQISAHQIEASQTELRTMLNGGACQGYIQSHRQMTIAGAGDLDIELDSGRGRMMDMFTRVVNNSLLSDTIVTNTSLLIGMNSRPLESTHLVLQDNAKRDFLIETTPSGTWNYAFNRYGELDQYVDLNNTVNVRGRYTCGAPTGTANIRVIEGVVIPEFYKEIANLQ